MCVMSMVYDHYNSKFPAWPDLNPPATVPASTPSLWDMVEMRRLVDEFKQAVAAAQKLDALIKQKDCFDKEKAALDARVAVLEKQLAKRSTTKRKARVKP